MENGDLMQPSGTYCVSFPATRSYLFQRSLRRPWIVAWRLRRCFRRHCSDRRSIDLLRAWRTAHPGSRSSRIRDFWILKFVKIQNIRRGTGPRVTSSIARREIDWRRFWFIYFIYLFIPATIRFVSSTTGTHKPWSANSGLWLSPLLPVHINHGVGTVGCGWVRVGWQRRCGLASLAKLSNLSSREL